MAKIKIEIEDNGDVADLTFTDCSIEKVDVKQLTLAQRYGYSIMYLAKHDMIYEIFNLIKNHKENKNNDRPTE